MQGRRRNCLESRCSLDFLSDFAFCRKEQSCPTRRQRSFACLAIASCRAVHAGQGRMEKAGGYVSVQFAWSLPVSADKLRLKHSKKRIYGNECQMFRPDYDDLLMRNRFLLIPLR